MNIARWSEENLHCFGDYDAVVVGGDVWRSTDVHARSCRFAGRLVAAGLSPGDRVLLALPNGLGLVVGFTGTLMAGGVAVPMVAGTTARELERVIAQCAPFAVFRTVGPIDTEGSPLREPVERADSDPALICFTGGTSSTPRGVVYTHGGVRARHPRANRRPRATEPMPVLGALPLATMGAMMLTGRLTSKTLLVAHDGFEPRRFVDAIARYRVQAVALVPSMAEAILALPDLQRHHFASLRNVTLGGADVPPDLLERLAALLPVAPSVSYGMTEAGGGISTSLFKRRNGERWVSTGGAMSSVEVKIRDEHDRELPSGDVGEICVKSPWLAVGYYGQPELTAAAFRDGWLRTGDLGYLDSRMELHVVGRRKQLIIQAGVNVYPSEVEAAVRRLPGVAACAIVGVPNPFLGEEVVACVVPSDGASVTQDAILAGCREQLEPRKTPVRAVMLPALPITPAGKVDLEALRGHALRAAPAKPVPHLAELRDRSLPERIKTLRALISEQVARLARRPITDAEDAERSDRSFGELGLDSLQLVTLAYRIGEALGHDIEPLLAYSAGTVASLAERLACDLFGTARPLASPQDREGRMPIALVGIGCRMPAGVEDPDALWTLLDAGVDAVDEVRRWDLTRGADGKGTPASATTRAAMLADVNAFDAPFFGMSSREAAAIDPQHRMVLEVTWQAVEDAGWNPLSLRGTPTGVFLGISGSGDPSLEGLGAAASMAAGRICHFLDLRGPAAVIDTACSSSLAAVHAAVQGLRAGECDVAIAGGVSVIGSPRSFVGLSQLGALAPDGRSKPFDANADGYGRGEGCVLFVLKPLASAQTQGDRILAVIRGTATVHDGRSASLISPNGQAQEAVIRRALDNGGVEPSSVDYLEAHGTGTPLGDPIELGAAVAVLGTPSRRLVVGSIKSNVGHLEAAAGAAGLLKVVLALQHGRIPAHLHFRRLHPLLEPVAGSVLIPAESVAWPRRADRPRIAGVTSMGLSGTNVHVVVEEPPLPRAQPAEGRAPDRIRPQLLCLSARSDAALDAQIRRVAARLSSVPDDEFADVCFTSAVGRAPFIHRATVVATASAAAADALRAHLQGSPAAVTRGHARNGAPVVAFLFSGHGTQHAGMGSGLYARHPVFRAALERCADALRSLVGPPLLAGLGLDAHPRPAVSPLDDLAFAQPALVSFAWALAELWKSWGVVPAYVAGHSIGECAAAAVAGLLSIEDALTLAAARGRLLASLTGIGGMVAVRGSIADIAPSLAACEERVSVAAINGPRSLVLSGHRPELERIIAALTHRSIETTWLAVPCAAHSPVTDPVLDELERVAGTLTYSRPRLPIVSTLTGTLASLEELSSPRYWRRQMRERVQFCDAVTALAERGCDAFVEIGPDSVLLGGAQDAARAYPGNRTWVASQRRERDDHEQMLASLGELFVHGIDPDWTGVYAGEKRRRAALPSYPFERPGRLDQPPPTIPVRQRVLTGTPEARESHLREWLRNEFALASNNSTKDIGINPNCLDLGLDSLRITDLASMIRRTLGVGCTPADIVSHPTVEDFARVIGARLLASHPPARPPLDSATAPPIGRSAPVRRPKPLVVLHRDGRQSPVFCFHPSGGRITPYLRLRGLLGNDQPLYAIQSRALGDAAREHTSLWDMAIDYASLVEFACDPPYQLFGWSLGGLVAHAVAHELERRGADVERVTMIDARMPASGQDATNTHDRALALTGWLLETEPRAALDDALVALRDSAGVAPVFLDWCRQHGLVNDPNVTAESIEPTLALYHRHFELARTHRAKPVAAPVEQWWAGPPPDDGRAVVGRDVRHHVLTGHHFSIMRPPAIDSIAASIAAGAGKGR